MGYSQSQTLSPLEGRVHGKTMQGEEARTNKVHAESLPVCQAVFEPPKSDRLEIAREDLESYLRATYDDAGDDHAGSH